MKKDKIVITGGGTGGHLLPMVSVADVLKDDYEVIFFTGREPMSGKIKGFDQFKQVKILSGKIHRYHSLTAYLKNISNIIQFSLGIVQAFFALLWLKPKLIFSKGGYASLPTVVAGHALHIPIIVHESDLTPGLANRIAIKYADKVCVSFPPANYNIPLKKIVYSGHILRELKVDSSIKQELGLADLPTLLVTGGSQGSLSINKNIAKILPELLKRMNVIHLSGEKDSLWLSELRSKLPESVGCYHLESFSPRILDYIAISDLILTRAGSNSLAEIAALKKPAIMIPYRYAAAGHQEDNANYVQKTGGGEIVLEEDLNPSMLKEKILSFIDDRDKLLMCGEKAFKANSFEGANVVKEIINEIIEKNGSEKN
jgi:UDP-N-acetylglucosamine--N-acetylmuramyl-(pentapeptide) pyrophosphoryl-undecaprenol N-acetylglucosamine transferase